MMEPETLGLLEATPAARAELRRLRAEHGPLMLVQSGGCCDCSLPICLPDGELLLGDGDLCLGEVEGCRFHVDRDIAFACAGCRAIVRGGYRRHRQPHRAQRL